MPSATMWWPTIWIVLRLTPTSRKLFNFLVTVYRTAGIVCAIISLRDYVEASVCKPFRHILRMRSKSRARDAHASAAGRLAVNNDDVSAPSAAFLSPETATLPQETRSCLSLFADPTSLPLAIASPGR